MARFRGLDVRLDPYVDDSNIKRSAEISRSRRITGRRNFSDGLSIVVLNLNSPDLLESILRGFELARLEFEARGTRIELILGDTGSSDPRTLRLINELPKGVRCVRNMRYHFSRNNNEVFELVEYATTLFLNNDVLISENPTAIMRSYAVHQRSREIVSVILDFPGGQTQHRGVYFLENSEHYGLPYHPGSGAPTEHAPGKEVQSPAVTGAFLMINSELFARLDGFDDRYLVECQDVDLCLRANRLGVGCRILDVGTLVHIENGTRPKGEENWPDRRRFTRLWSSYLETL
jgi:GT2 family glycosyltransferase